MQNHKKELAEEKKRLKLEKFHKKEQLQNEWKNPKNKSKKQITKIHVNTTTLADRYEPCNIETKMYAVWEKAGYFVPKKSDQTFIMILPPPNVTGALHIGHALTCTIEDLIARWHRMHGARTLFIPGTDAGGLATQTIVEKKIHKEEKKTRQDLGREVFVEKIWQWKEKYGATISGQIKRMGASLDWSREEFTMSDKLEKATREAFIRCYNDKLITRSTRLINWCPMLKTCISDIECDDLIINEPTLLQDKYEFGVIWSIAYKIDGCDDKIIIATTRPETIFGDVAIAVHPNDERHKHLHGKFVQHPLLNKKIPIITDSILVKKDFGTGAVKITPGHNVDDYKCAKRHNLPIINIFNDDVTLNQEAGEFAGLMRYDARIKVLDKLTELKILIEKKNNPMTIKICSRSGDIIEPSLKLQWWLSTKKLAGRVLDAIKEKHISINPERKTKELKEYLENIENWCLSRQTWWGNKIPAYQYWQDENNKQWVVAHDIIDAKKQISEILRSNDFNIQQDPDVLDTWFGSAIYPFTILGWPDNTLDQYYPHSLLETGYDILFAWVAKMLMMGLQLTGELPFKNILLHGIVRDSHGEKMSKSKGNVIDPIFIIDGASLAELNKSLEQNNLKPSEIEKAIKNQTTIFPNGIKKYGADVLRISLCSYVNDGKDINLDIKRVDGYKNFCDKIWNAVKFSLMFLPENYKVTDKIVSNNVFDRFIISKLYETLQLCDISFAKYDFIAYIRYQYSFWRNNFCDTYLELIKAAERKEIHYSTLAHVLDAGLKLMHPIMPFITDELWKHIPKHHDNNFASLCIAKYPDITDYFYDSDSISNIEHLLKIVTMYRTSNIVLKISNDDSHIVDIYGREILSLTKLKYILF